MVALGCKPKFVRSVTFCTITILVNAQFHHASETDLTQRGLISLEKKRSHFMITEQEIIGAVAKPHLLQDVLS